MNGYLWLSMTLLLMTYGVLGWQTAQFVANLGLNPVSSQPLMVQWIERSLIVTVERVLVWAGVIGGTILLAGGLTSPVANMRARMAKWAQSDLQAFIAVLIAGVSLVFVLRWIQIASHLLMIVAATTLARLEVDQRANLGKFQDFLIVGGMSLMGLALGNLAYHLSR